ncbi:MAG: hypothetical protein NT094_00110 [Candidatus Staskawiczbacteria bacterium]|nr:hypothetical protein [Candidatus Staskawiczbacteria bacterium]
MEIIDVTLRESVYCDEPISYELGLEIIRRLSEAGIDYIEIGYLKKNYDTKSFFMNYDKDYIEKAYLLSKEKSKLAAMIHPEDFYSNNWDIETIKKLSLVRVCVNRKNILQMKPLVDFFHKLGVKVSFNLTHVSTFKPKECVAILKIAIKNSADFFYIADSNGNLLPDDVEKYIKILIKNAHSRIKIGFHPHNNLGLSQINALIAAENGSKIIDSSMLGFGKGAGNLRTELFPLLFFRKKILGKFKYNIEELFKTARYFNSNITKINSFEEQYKYSLYGSKNVGLREDQEIKKIATDNNIKDYDLALIYVNECNCNFGKLKVTMSNRKKKKSNE